MKKLLNVLLTLILSLLLSFSLVACDSGDTGKNKDKDDGGENAIVTTAGAPEGNKPSNGTTGSEKEENKPSEPEVKYSEGLSFTSNGDGTCYVSGIGTCTDTEIIIPKVSPNGDIVTCIGFYLEAGYGVLFGVDVVEKSKDFSDCTELISVIIPNTVKTIGEGAFYGCTKLNNIIIPDSVTTIGANAFDDTAYYDNDTNWNNGVLYIGNNLIEAKETLSGNYAIKPGTKIIAAEAFESCTLLENIVIPNSVTNICYGAFDACEALTSITIPDSVTKIGSSAFDACEALTSITIPDSVKSIGEYAFDDTAYYYNDANWDNGVLYIGNHLIEAKRKLSGSYVIKSGTKTIADSAFYYCDKLENVTIPDSVITIGEEAFYVCNELNKITIGKGVISIGENAFGERTALTVITVDSNNKTYHSKDNCLIKTASKTLVAGCKTSIIPEDGSVTIIGNYAFYNCNGLTRITIPNSVTSIGESAFYNCDKLTSITLPDSVTFIGTRAFIGCTDLTSITVDSNNKTYHSKGNCLIETASKTLVFGCKTSVIPEDGSVTIIGDYAFDSCSTLTNITIPNSVTTIGAYAFSDCSALSSVTISDGVTTIGNYAFYNCNGLTSITIPNNVTSIGIGAFYVCSNLTSITIPSTVTNIGSGAFTYCLGLTAVHITDLAAWNNINFGNFYANPLNCAKNLYLNGNKVTDLIIPENFTKIGSYAFAGCTSITSITIPNSVTIIGDGAFEKCSGITSVSIGNGVTTIGNYAFYNCNGLMSITIPDTVTIIGNYAFYDCRGIENITIGGSLASIGDNVFVRCKNSQALPSTAKKNNGIKSKKVKLGMKIQATTPSTAPTGILQKVNCKSKN